MPEFVVSVRLPAVTLMAELAADVMLPSVVCAVSPSPKFDVPLKEIVPANAFERSTSKAAV
jgi:hypothetical protein